MKMDERRRLQNELGPTGNQQQPYDPNATTAQAGAPLRISLRPSCTWDHYYVTVFPDQPDAIAYVRSDVVEAALEALEDDDRAEAREILRACLRLV